MRNLRCLVDDFIAVAAPVLLLHEDVVLVAIRDLGTPVALAISEYAKNWRLARGHVAD